MQAFCSKYDVLQASLNGQWSYIHKTSYFGLVRRNSNWIFILFLFFNLFSILFRKTEANHLLKEKKIKHMCLMQPILWAVTTVEKLCKPISLQLA